MMRDIVLKKNFKIDSANLPMICLGLFLVMMFSNPDPYLGIADHYFFLIAYVAFYFLCKKRVLMNMDTKIILFMLGWMGIACVVALFEGEFSSGYTLSYLLYAITLLMINGTKYSKKELDFFVNSYIISALIICLFIIVFRYDYYGSGGERFTIKVLGNQAIDPNYLGAYLVVPFIISYGRLIKIINYKDIISVIVLGVGLLSTASRGALLSVFLGVFVTTFLYFKDNKQIRKMLLLVLAILIGCVVIMHFVPINSLVRLFEFGSYADRSNSKRLSNWLVGIEAFAKRPLFGYGLQGEMTIIQDVTGKSQIAHNTYIAILLQFGGIGALLFGLYMCYILRINKKNSTIIGSLVGTAVAAIFISGQVATFFWAPIMLASIVAKCEKNEIITVL